MAETRSVTVTRHIAAAPEQVFDAWLDPASAGRWLFATPGGVMEKVEIDARVGGGFTIVERRGGERAEHFGEYRELDRPRRIAFDFWTSFGAERTRVAVDLAPDGGGCLVRLSHEGVWADFEAKTRQGWAAILAELELELEGDGR